MEPEAARRLEPGNLEAAMRLEPGRLEAAMRLEPGSLEPGNLEAAMRLEPGHLVAAGRVETGRRAGMVGNEIMGKFAPGFLQVVKSVMMNMDY